MGNRGREVIRTPVACFVPCCKSKNASGRIEGEGRGLTQEDLPNTWNSLLKGRNGIRRIADERKDSYIDPNSPQTSAIYLYTGAMYNQFNLNEVLREIREGCLRLFMISAWYGIVDAFEPLHEYEAEMKGEIARHWRNCKLEKVICDLVLTLKPHSVLGFFAGKEHWSGSLAKYRYFFSAGLNDALRSGLDTNLSGCFYSVSGRGVQPILGALGRTLADFVRSGLSEEFVSTIARNRRVDGDVVIGFNGLT